MKHTVDRAGLRHWDEKETRLEAAHILDLIESVYDGETRQVTPFLTVAMRDWVEAVLKKEHLAFIAEGGFSEAERVRILLGPWGEALDSKEADVSLLWVRPIDLHAQLEHRQILGSLMALGFRRDVLGDIQPGQGGYFVASTTEVAPFIINHWTQAGREKVIVSHFTEQPVVNTVQGEECRVTVNSSRMDAVIANAFRVSRSVAQEWINQGKVRRDGVVVSKAETEVQPDNMISCRGYGRIKLLECSKTRKDKIAWQIVLFRSQRH